MTASIVTASIMTKRELKAALAKAERELMCAFHIDNNDRRRTECAYWEARIQLLKGRLARGEYKSAVSWHAA